jgi:GNAT superfamily N-acetyltransferase
MRLREFAPSPERDDSDDIPDQLVVLANRWWNATDKQPQIEHVLNSLGWSIQQVESEDDAVQLQHRDGTTYFISADDFDPDLFEIARIPQSELGDWGEAGTLEPPKDPVKKKELPGGSGYTYAVNKTGKGDLEIMIFDGDNLAAELDLFETQDVLGTWGVETVVVERPYRGQGLGKALYGIALSILKLPIEAGQTQTKHGQAMWLMLNSIPGVEVQGYNMVPTEKYKAHKGDHIVKQDADWTRYTFPVRPGKQSMRSGRPGAGLYNSQATMIAKWTGR